METQKPPKLLQHAEGLLPQAAQPHLIACCPTMDLIAFVNQDEQLNVYRFGGQRAFGLQKKEGNGRIVSLGWKFNGQYIAVGWSSGIVEVVSAETGAALQHFRQPNLTGRSRSTSHATGVSCIGWGLNFIDVDAVRRKTASNRTNGHADQKQFETRTIDDWNEIKERVSLDDFLERIPDVGKVEIPLDLPEQVAKLDITTSMIKPPALPLLPPAAYKGGDHPAAELFSSQVSLDAAISSNQSNSINGLEALLLAQDNGQVRLILYDTLSIGEVSLPAAWHMKDIKFRHCASHPFSSTYMFLVDYKLDGQVRTALIPLSLRFLHSSGSNLYIIESKTAQLETMVQYIGETLTGIAYHWKHAQELPQKFMGNVNEELAEKQEPNLVQSLFHLAATGDCPPTLKEWLVDILAERGHKRWDHSIMHGYTKVRELAHERLLPALDRCVAILTHLRGLAIYHEHSKIFNVDVAIFDSILNIIRCMRLLAHHTLLYCSEETQQFITFSKWLRHEIDVQAAQTPPNPAEEVEQHLDIDLGQLLAYIQGPLEKSKLDVFVIRDEEAAPVFASSSIYDDLKRELDAFKVGDESRKGVFNMNGYLKSWITQHGALVDQITSHQRASSTIVTGLVLEEGEVFVSDMCMVDRAGSTEHFIDTIIAVVHQDKLNEVHLSQVTHLADFEDAKSVRDSCSAIVALPDASKVRDLKFVVDGLLMLLIEHKQSSHLLEIKTAGNDLLLMGRNGGSDVEQMFVPNGQALHRYSHLHSLDEANMQQRIRHTFDSNERFKPARIEVNGRKNRRFVVVLGEDGRQFRILDLDFDAESASKRSVSNGADDDDEDDEMVDG